MMQAQQLDRVDHPEDAELANRTVPPLGRMRALEAVIENFPGGIALYDAELRMILCNANLRRMLDYPDHLFNERMPTLAQVFQLNAERGEYGPGAVELIVERRMALVKEHQPHQYERERPNGTILQVRGVPLEDGGFLSTYLDITDDKRREAIIDHMAYHDILTNLPNRYLFRDRLEIATANARRGFRMALLHIDLDGFKSVNNRFGQSVGDQLLRAAAGRLRNVTRETDTLARINGDEFVIIQTTIQDISDAEFLANRVIDALNQRYSIGDHSIETGASIGIALAPEDTTDPDQLLKQAEAALQICKAERPGTFRYWRF